MKLRLLSALGMSVAVTGGLLAASVPATAAPGGVAAMKCAATRFCAWEHDNYSGLLLLSVKEGSGQRVEVADNRVSSGSNNTANLWVGVNYHAGPIPDDDLFKWSPYSETASIGPGANDRIDYFSSR